MDTPLEARLAAAEEDLAHCRALDAADPLADLRGAFELPDGVVYLDGNSLGPLPRAARERLDDAVRRQWGQGLIRSWNDEGWIHLPLTTGRKIARLIGAKRGEVAVADSTSVNLFKLLATALRLKPGRSVIVTEKGNFPSDLYIIDGLADWLGRDIEVRRAEPGRVAELITDEVAVVSVTHVNYRTGWMHDMPGLTERAHRSGALMLWDLAHSAGSVPLELDAWGVDLAVGCGYKFLNGGPGAPSFLYVAERWQDRARQPLAGWLGHARPFDFTETYEPAEGIARNLCGTPPVLSLLALDAALDVFDGVDLHAVRNKALALGEVFVGLVDRHLAGHGFELVSPRDGLRRGSQVSLAHEHGYAIMKALIDRGFIGDFRAPDILRFGLTPLYQRFEDLWRTVAALREIMESGAWREPRYRTRDFVT